MTRKDVLQVRVSEAEKQAIAANALRAGLKVSDWVRSQALRGASSSPAVKGVLSPEAQAGADGRREGVKRAIKDGALDQPEKHPFEEAAGLKRGSEVLYSCPRQPCSFKASSPNAICNAHGAKVR